jgi:hypothetical protein
VRLWEGVPIRVLRNGCVGSARSGSTGILFVSGPLLKLDPLRLRLFVSDLIIAKIITIDELVYYLPEGMDGEL